MSVQSLPSRKRPRKFINLDAVSWASTVDQPKGLARALLFALARSADRFGCSWNGRATLAKEVGCKPRTISTHLGTLKRLGLIRVVGRLGPHGGRISNVVQLTEWPGRIASPRSGHPTLGHTVQEDRWSALLRERTSSGTEHYFPEGPANPASQNNTVEINTTTEVSLKACLDALGAWATDNNREKLIRSAETLEALLKEGFGLEADILPLLRAKASSRAVVPDLASWNYFRSALEARRARPTRKRATKKPALQPRTPRPSEPEPPAPLAAHTEASRDCDSIKDVLRRVSKTRVMQAGAEWL